MAKQRMAGARDVARLAACAFLVFSPLARADDPPAPFPEYIVGDDYLRDPSEAGFRAMEADCQRFSLAACQLLSVRTTTDGYTYAFQYAHQRPGGDVEWLRREDGGPGVWSCPAESALYMVAFGMTVGPFPNRAIDLGGPFPVVCRSDSATSPIAQSPSIEDRYDAQGRVVGRDVLGADGAVHWSIEGSAAGLTVYGAARDWQADYRVAGGRVTTIGDQATLAYAEDGSLVDVRGVDGTSIGGAGTFDPEGRLRSLLGSVASRVPSAGAPGALGAVGRMGESVQALLDGEPGPHQP